MVRLYSYKEAVYRQHVTVLKTSIAQVQADTVKILYMEDLMR